MVNHGFSTAALFLIAGFLISRRGSRLIADYGGVQKVAPMLAGTFLVAGLSSLALPGLSSSSASSWCWSAPSRATRWRRSSPPSASSWPSLYILLMYQRTMTGEPNERRRRAAGPQRAARRGSWRRCSR